MTERKAKAREEVDSFAALRNDNQKCESNGNNYYRGPSPSLRSRVRMTEWVSGVAERVIRMTEWVIRMAGPIMERGEMPAWMLLSVVRVVLDCCCSWEAKNWLKIGSEGVPLPGHYILSIPVYKR